MRPAFGVRVRHPEPSCRMQMRDAHGVAWQTGASSVTAARAIESLHRASRSIELSKWEVLMTAPRETIDRQLAAYNHRDREFVSCYASDTKVVQPDGSLLASGRVEIRARYGELFSLSPNLRAEIRNRIEVGSVVIDEEYVTGFFLPGMPTEIHAAVVYRVANDLIQDAHLFG